MTLSQSPVSYDQDFNMWIEHTVELLKTGCFEQLDIENLVDELESMSRRDKREILSRLTIILLHLLKWNYQLQHRNTSWRSSIQTNRREIQLILADSPGLKNYPLSVLEKAYTPARKDAADETGLPLTTFPESCPYSMEFVLNQEFWPE